MNMLIAVCITVLFSAWVFTLKQEVDYLHKRVWSAKNGSQRKHANADAPAPSRRVQRTVSTTAGVPTWTIE